MRSFRKNLVSWRTREQSCPTDQEHLHPNCYKRERKKKKKNGCFFFLDHSILGLFVMVTYYYPNKCIWKLIEELEAGGN